MKYRTKLFLASLCMSLLLQWQRQRYRLPVSDGLWFYIDLVWGAIELPFAWQWRLINRYSFGLDPDADFWRYTGLLLLFSLSFWFFPVARVERWLGVHDPLAAAARSWPRYLRWLEKIRPLSWAASLLDELDKLRFGSSKTGGWS